MSRQPNTTATWRRPNDKHWCNVCKVFVDGNPNKIRQHEAAGRHQNNMRQQMKALRRREFDQKRIQQESEAEIRAIEHAAVAALHGDTQAGFVRSSALAAAGNYLHEPPVARVPGRVGPRVYRGPEQDRQQQVELAQDDDRFPEHQFFAAEPPPPVVVDYVKRADVEVDEATGMGVWESVPVEERTAELEQEDDLEVEEQQPQPNPDMVAPVAFADIDEFTEREQIAELDNDYGLPAIRIQAQQQKKRVKAEARAAATDDEKDTKPSVDQKVQFSFKKRRKTTKPAGQ